MPLKFLQRNPSLQILWFLDSFGIFDQVIRSLDRQTIMIYSFSWYVSPKRLARILADFTEALASHDGKHVSHSSIIMLANSKEELDHMRNSGVDFQFVLINDVCLLDYEKFQINHDQSIIYDAVCNSKPVAFKRHYLSELVKSKCFITYFPFGEPNHGLTKRVDLRAYHPCKIYKNIPTTKVVDVLNSSRVGLILSEVEGIAKASCEYLLCGLPVVSTPSRGGRAEFYDNENSIIVEPSSVAVADAVAECIRRLQLAPSLRSRIRANTITRMEAFRQRFVEVLADTIRKLQGDMAMTKNVAVLIAGSSKIESHRNSYMSSL